MEMPTIEFGASFAGSESVMPLDVTQHCDADAVSAFRAFMQQPLNENASLDAALRSIIASLPDLAPQECDGGPKCRVGAEEEETDAPGPLHALPVAAPPVAAPPTVVVTEKDVTVPVEAKVVTPVVRDVAVADAVPEAAPVEVPEETPDAVPVAAKVVTPVVRDVAVADAVPEAAPVEVPEVTADAVPEAAPVEVPEETPDAVPAETKVVTPVVRDVAVADAVPEAAPVEVPEAAPDAVPVETKVVTPVVRDVAVADAVPEAAPVEVPEAAPVEVPEETFDAVIDDSVVVQKTSSKGREQPVSESEDAVTVASAKSDTSVVVQAVPTVAAQTVQAADVVSTAALPATAPVAAATPAAIVSPVETFVAAAEAVASAVRVSPELQRGEAGEIRVQLRPDVLNGSEVVIAVDGKELQVTIHPADVASAQVVASNGSALQTQMQTSIAQVASGFAVTLAVTSDDIQIASVINMASLDDSRQRRRRR